MSEIALLHELPRDITYAHGERRGLAAWLTATDHKRIGMLYIMASLVFFAIGAGIAITMRTQTMQPGMKVLSAEQYNQAFSLHGTTMIFLFAMPILIGFANYLVPLMIGARDMAFPRLNALSVWLFLFGGLTLYSGLLFGGVLDTGWFSYAPLTEKAFSPHDGVSIWIIALALLGISSVAGAINFIMTMLRLRAPGMRWRDMPMFCIATFINSFLILFAFPSLTAALGLLYLDRFYHTGWYNPARGGALEDAAALRQWPDRPVHGGRHQRRTASLGALRLAGQRKLLHRRPPAQRALLRHRLRGLRRLLLLVSPDVRPHAVGPARQVAFLGHHRRLPHDLHAHVR